MDPLWPPIPAPLTSDTADTLRWGPVPPAALPMVPPGPCPYGTLGPWRAQAPSQPPCPSCPLTSAPASPACPPRGFLPGLSSGLPSRWVACLSVCSRLVCRLQALRADELPPPPADHCGRCCPCPRPCWDSSSPGTGLSVEGLTQTGSGVQGAWGHGCDGHGQGRGWGAPGHRGVRPGAVPSPCGSVSIFSGASTCSRPYPSLHPWSRSHAGEPMSAAG